MADEPTPNAAAPSGEPTPTPTPQSAPQATPTPPAAAEGTPDLPEWATAPLDAGGPPSAGYDPGYQRESYIPQPPAYPPQPYPQPYAPPSPYPQPYGYPDPRQANQAFIDSLAQDGRGTIRNEVLGAVAPLLQGLQAQQARLAQLDDFGKRQHEANVVRGFETARSTVRSAYESIYAKDPAFGSKAVRDRVDFETRRYLADQITRAYHSGDFSGLEVARTEKPYRLILAAAKMDANWNETAGRIDMRGAHLESSRSQPQGGYTLSEDERAAAQVLGMSDEDYWKEKQESQKRGGL